MEYQTESEFKELLEIYKALPQRRCVLEIGSLTGETLKEWVTLSEDGAIVVSVDKLVPSTDSRYPRQSDSHARFNLMPGVCVIEGYSQSQEVIKKVNAIFSPKSVDFLFIDAGHEYHEVKADYENYAPLVKDGGVIAFHDIQKGYPGVTRFWNEVRANKDYRDICHPDGWGIGVIFKRPIFKPILHVITPCMRPQNLQRVSDSLKPSAQHFKVHWWVMMDEEKTGKNVVIPHSPHLGAHALFVSKDEVGEAGKGSINLALRHFSDGWVWVLDDDNEANPDFFAALHKRIINDDCSAIAFAQVTKTGIRHASPDACKEHGIDQAQFVMSREFIGDERYNLHYNGDGQFAEKMFRKSPGAWWFCDEALTNYNSLT